MQLRRGHLIVGRRKPQPISRRSVGTKSPRKRILVVAEGSKTEPDYLGLLQPLCQAALIELEVVEQPATHPRGIVQHAVSIRNRMRKDYRRTKDPNALIDEIWCMFDVDEHAFLHEARQQAVDNQIGLAISNPSFELWLLLHFESQSAFLTRKEASRGLARYIPGYCKTIDSLDVLEGRFDSARKRARALDKKHEGDGTSYPGDNPSSGVWRLIDSIGGGY